MGNQKKSSFTEYLHFQNTYGNQTSQSGDFPWEATTNEATWPFKNVTKVWSRDKLNKIYDSKIWQSDELGEGPPPIRPYDKIKTFYLHFLKIRGYQTLQDFDLKWGAHTHEAKKPFDQTITWRSRNKLKT